MFVFFDVGGGVIIIIVHIVIDVVVAFTHVPHGKAFGREEEKKKLKCKRTPNGQNKRQQAGFTLWFTTYARWTSARKRVHTTNVRTTKIQITENIQFCTRIFPEFTMSWIRWFRNDANISCTFRFDGASVWSANRVGCIHETFHLYRTGSRKNQHSFERIESIPSAQMRPKIAQKSFAFRSG